jgi:hypothetical protein
MCAPSLAESTYGPRTKLTRTEWIIPSKSSEENVLYQSGDHQDDDRQPNQVTETHTPHHPTIIHHDSLPCFG